MILFNCQCGNTLFFENTACIRCLADVGYDSSINAMCVFNSAQDVSRCQNGQKYNVCNWAVSNRDDNPLCPACRLNRVIPDLSVGGNIENWRRLEAAKRRALHTLLRYKL